MIINSTAINMAALISTLYQYLITLSPLSLTQYMYTLLSILPVLFLIRARTRSSPIVNPCLPPSPPSLPLLGHLHRLGSLPHRSMHRLSVLYGPVMHLRLGNVPTVVLSSSSAVEKSICCHDVTLSSRPRTAVSDILLYGSCDVTFSSYGEYWRQIRRVCVLHLLSAKRVRSFGSIREEEVLLLIQKIRLIAQNNGGCSGTATVVNLSSMMVKLTNDIVCRAALGRKFSDDGSKKAYALLADFGEHLGKPLIGEHVRCLRWLDWFTKKRIKKTAEGLDCVLEDIIEGHVKAESDALGDGKRRDRKDGNSSDLVDVLLNIQENDEEIGISLSRKNIKAVILDLFAAGTDTVFTALEWAMAELIRNPTEMKKVQEEVRNMVRAAGKLTDELVKNMAYLNAALKETLRLHPPVPLLVPRESTKDIDLMGYQIPAGTRFIFNAWAIGRDRNTWERADEFMPERFLGSNVDYKGLHFRLIPFGVGRRTCPGIGFAEATIAFTLASLLYHFDWGLPNDMKGKQLDMSEVNGVSVHKKLNLILEARPHSY